MFVGIVDGIVDGMGVCGLFLMFVYVLFLFLICESFVLTGVCDGFDVFVTLIGLWLED